MSDSDHLYSPDQVLTVMTSPARTLRAVGSWRFQKSLSARTFRIPEASKRRVDRCHLGP